MEEACGLASLKMGKLAQYNKGKFDEKAKAAELVVGDRVLMRNKKEKMGTGKLHSYFEESLSMMDGSAEETIAYDMVDDSVDETVAYEEGDIVDPSDEEEGELVANSSDENPDSDIGSDASPPVRRSSRARNPVRIFTYDEIGGQPSHAPKS